jgi:type I restriction enzyme S subunit
MNNWKKYKLGEIAERMTSGGTPSTRKSEYYGGNIPWLRTQEVNFNRIYDTEIKITEDAIKNSSAKFIKENSIVVAMYGATAGRIAINKIPLTTNQACCNITIDKDKADYNYVYYFLKSKFEEILKLATGAAQQNLNAGMLRDLEILAPDLPTQTQIAQILTSFDDKIECLTQMNQTLETMAQAIFKEWFVDFNFPKMSVHDLKDYKIDTIKKDTISNGNTQKSCQSNNSENPVEDYLPEGWRRGKLGEILQPKKGKNITKSQVTEGEVPVVAGGLEPSCYHNKSNTNAPVVTVSSSGANAGFVRLYHTPVWSSDSCYIDGSVYPYVYYAYLILNLNQEKIYKSQEGCAQPHIYARHIMDLDFYICDEKIVAKFDKIITPFFEKMKENSNQIRTLTQLRDSLLPKLMSGKCLNMI